MKNFTVNVEGKDCSVFRIGSVFSGYGHQKLTCRFLVDGKAVEHTITTTNTQLTDELKSDDFAVEEEAMIVASINVISDYLDQEELRRQKCYFQEDEIFGKEE